MSIYDDSKSLFEELMNGIGDIDINQLLKEHPPTSFPNFGEFNSFYGKTHTDEFKQRMSGSNNPFYGKTHTDELKAKWSNMYSGENNPFYGKEHSNNTKSIISQKNKGNKGRTGYSNSSEHRKKISESRLGKVASEETKKKMSESRRKYMITNSITHICPVCGKEGVAPSIYRHIKNCKSFEYNQGH